MDNELTRTLTCDSVKKKPEDGRRWREDDNDEECFLQNGGPAKDV